MKVKIMKSLPMKRLASGNLLKTIAVISMIIDHFGSIVMDGVIAPYQVNDMVYFTESMPFFVLHAFTVKSICDILGSIAFPIFCFMIAEGFTHTHDQVKYGLRVGLFALLSEIPFDLAHYQQFFCFSLQNVMFTLCISIFTLLGISLIEKRCPDGKRLRIVLTVVVTAAGMGLAFLVRGEYVFIGVLVICLLYLLRNAGYLRMVAFAPMLIVSAWALLAVIPLLFYDGTRGKGSKYFFYYFYPAHFLLFAGLSYILSIRVI